MHALTRVFFEGFIGGFAAFLMPCIYPMLPLTVSFFTKRAGSKKGALGLALLYGASIVFIYVLLGSGLTFLLGPTTLNNIASSAAFNLIVFLLLVLFAISFFGAYEINLPSSWVNRADAQSGANGIAGIFFMALTLSLVSFSCTAGIIGTLLVEAVRSKQYGSLMVGMSGFSLALALPFTLAAIFPSLLSKVPRSGGWLNSVKVVLGFIELALSLKFFSTFDITYHTHLLDRDIFLALWIVIFALLGFYLLGKLKFAHDSDVPYVSVSRFFLSIVSFSFAVYMVPGLWGAPLPLISGLTPPLYTQQFVSATGATVQTDAENVAAIVYPSHRKYVTLLHEPNGLSGFFDLKEGLVFAATVNKPVLLDFTGHSCTNCRKMEENVWTRPEVLKRLRENFVLISLYVDERTKLPESEQYFSKFSNARIETVGDLNSDIEAVKFNTNSQPFYVIANTKGIALEAPQQFNLDINNYIKFLDRGLALFRSSKQ